MSRSIWEKLLGDSLVSDAGVETAPLNLAQSIKQIKEIEKNMLTAIDTIGEPDYIGDFIQRGGLIGLEPMGFNAPVEATPDITHTRLAQVALNHSRLESAVSRFKKNLKDTFFTLNESISNGSVSYDASTQQALADIITHKEKAKEDIRSLVLKPKTVETMYACFDKIDQDTKKLQKEFERCAKLQR